ncbi:MAG: LD-carboxypeptidase [Actinobacteria bacterium]|nr:LD-carboxypeptidase [Actinomycetota bacterium]
MNTSISFPPALPVGGHIRVVSPGFASLVHAPQRARRARSALAALGFRVSYGSNCLKVDKSGECAGTPQDRAEDIHEAFSDPEVDLIMAASGGPCDAVLPLLEPNVIRKSPKPFVGYCGNGALNYYLASKVGLVSYYGQVFMTQFGEAGGPFKENIEAFRRALMSTERLVCSPMPWRTNEWYNWLSPKQEGTRRQSNLAPSWHWLRRGRCRGTFIGAEIAVLLDLTQIFDIEMTDTILFLGYSAANDLPFALQLERLAARIHLDQLHGMVVSCHPRLAPGEWAAEVDQALRQVIPESTIPIAANVDVGYLDPTWVVPYGSTATLDSRIGLVFRG